MRTKIFTLSLALAASVGTLLAWDYERVQIGDLYYNLDATLQTAEVTSENSTYPYWSTAITTADIPSSVTYDFVTYNVTAIGDNAFDGNSSLTSIIIPNSVTSIGDYAFDYCTSLMPVTIPNSVTSIGDGAFWGCNNLTSIEIPNSVTTIGNSAFSFCSGLTSITIPNSVTSIGEGPFGSCTSLTAIVVATDNPNYSSEAGVLFNKDKTALVAYPKGKLSSTYTIPNTVTSIGEGAFYDCTGLTSVTMGNSVTIIVSNAFLGCTSLTSITIPNSVTSIGDGAFRGCSGFTSMIVEAGNTTYDSRNGCNAIIETASNTLVAGCQNTIIPNSVISIGVNAFYDCTGLNSITIPNSVTSIGGGAFWGCTGLTSVSIGNSVTSIGNSAFSFCTGLTTLTIPNSVTSIGEGPFGGCTGLTAIDVATDNPNYCSDAGVLFNKDKTTLVAFPKGKPGNTYTIPNTVTSIGEGAFYDCTGLTSVTMGNSVTIIVSNAFLGCTSLTSMTCEAVTPTTLGYDVFDGVDKSIPLYVPAGSISAYQAADQWRDFTNIQAIPTMAITANEDPLNAGDYYTTFYHGTNRYRLPDNGTEAYVADLSGGELLLTRIAQGSQVLPNNVAVIFRAPTSTITLSETSTTGVSFSAKNDLRGVDVVTPLEDLGLTRSTCYVLSGNSTDGVGFYQCNSDNLKAHKAYLPYAGGPAGAPKHIRFVFDETEDVGQVQGENVQGTKVLRKGQLIIIRNGVEYNIAGQIVK